MRSFFARGSNDLKALIRTKGQKAKDPCGQDMYEYVATLRDGSDHRKECLRLGTTAHRRTTRGGNAIMLGAFWKKKAERQEIVRRHKLSRKQSMLTRTTTNTNSGRFWMTGRGGGGGGPMLVHSCRKCGMSISPRTTGGRGKTLFRWLVLQIYCCTLGFPGDYVG